MTFLDSSVDYRQGESAQVTVPASATVGTTIIFTAMQTVASSTHVFSLVSSNGGTFSELVSTRLVGDDGGMWAQWSRPAVAGDANSLVTVNGGASSGRWLFSVVVVNGVSDSITSEPRVTISGGSTFTSPPATPTPGSSGGTELHFFMGVLKKLGTVYAPPSRGVMRENVSGSTPDSHNPSTAIVSATFSGDGQVAGITTVADQSVPDKAYATVLIPSGSTPSISAAAQGDVSSEVGAAVFNLTATDSAEGGATITSRQWTQAGTAVTLANATTATVEVTPPTTGAGTTTTLTYTVNDVDNGLTDSDEVVITWVAQPTGTLTPVVSRVKRVDATSYGSPVTLTADAGNTHPSTITEPIEGMFLVDIPDGQTTDLLYTLSADDGLADPVTVTIAPESAGTALIVELVATEGGWGVPLVDGGEAPPSEPTFLRSYAVASGIETEGWTDGTYPSGTSTITVATDHVVCQAGGAVDTTHYARKLRSFPATDDYFIDASSPAGRFRMRADFELPSDFYTNSESFMRWFNVDNFPTALSGGGGTVGSSSADEWRVGFGPVSTTTKYPCLMSYHENNQDMNLWQGTEQLAIGRHVVEIDFTPNTPGLTDGAWVLTIDGVIVAQASNVQTVPESVLVGDREITTMFGGIDGAYAQDAKALTVNLYALAIEQP